MKTLQDLLTSKRKKLKLSLREAAKSIGISHSYLSNLEKGIDPRTSSPINPTPETLRLISQAYDISYENLMIISGYIQPTKNDNSNSNKNNYKDDPSDNFLAEFKNKVEERGLDLDENSLDDLLDLYEIIQKRDRK